MQVRCRSSAGHAHHAVVRSAVIALLLALPGCAGQPLENWHTRRLNEEFTAKDAATVRTFADYRALEERLFQELRDKIYTSGGGENLLVRYSEGSAADPLIREPNWNRSFELPVANPIGGVLLLHGMSDSPYSLKAIGESLQQRGYYVVGMRMPGHGTAPSGLVYVHWQDMAAALDLGMAHLKAQVPGRPIHLIGYSTGASLALDYSLRVIEGTASPRPASLVFISPAVGITAAAGLAKIPKALAKIPGLKKLSYTAIDPEFDPYKYNSFTANAGDQVNKVTGSVSSRLGKIGVEALREGLPPILAFQSTVDATVVTQALVDKLLKRLDPGPHELVLFDINRFGAVYTLLVADPAPVTNRIIADEQLPFAVTLVSNKTDESMDVIAMRKLALRGDTDSVEDLHLEWPPGVISLSHVAMPISPRDPLYGNTRPANREELFLGDINIKGEKGLLKIPASYLVRLRYNPFYPYLERRAVDWIDHANQAAGGR